MKENFNAIGIDLGGTNIKAVLIDADGEVLRRLQEPIVDSEEQQGKQWKNAIKEMIQVLQKTSGHAALPIGLSAPGIPNKEASAIAYMAGRLYGLVGFNWAQFIGLHHLPVLNAAKASFNTGKEGIPIN